MTPVNPNIVQTDKTTPLTPSTNTNNTNPLARKDVGTNYSMPQVNSASLTTPPNSKTRLYSSSNGIDRNSFDVMFNKVSDKEVNRLFSGENNDGELEQFDRIQDNTSIKVQKLNKPIKRERLDNFYIDKVPLKNNHDQKYDNMSLDKKAGVFFGSDKGKPVVKLESNGLRFDESTVEGKFDVSFVLSDISSKEFLYYNDNPDSHENCEYCAISAHLATLNIDKKSSQVQKEEIELENFNKTELDSKISSFSQLKEQVKIQMNELNVKECILSCENTTEGYEFHVVNAYINKNEELVIYCNREGGEVMDVAGTDTYALYHGRMKN